MRLRTLEPYWLIKNGLINSYPSLHQNEQCDIVVIGGGITGALVSFSLIQKGYQVVLIDKGDIGMGSTSATTSMLQYEIDVPLYKLIGQIGEKGAVECYKAGINAINTLGQMINEWSVDCDFEYKQSLYISRSQKDADWLKKEFEARNKFNLGVKWLDKKEIFDLYDINCFGAILSGAAASADAYRLTHKLIELSIKKGMKVYDQTPVKKFELNKPFPTVFTENDCKVNCKKIIFCNGYEAIHLLNEKICELFYTYASISEQHTAFKKNLSKTLVWDTGKPYFYLRTTNDGRILIGGADTGFNSSLFQQSIKNHKGKQLTKHLSQIMPAINYVEDFSWGGTFGSTKDGLPYIGKSPEYENALFVLGFGGNGIVFSVQAMEIINDLLIGKENTLAYWYRFNR